MATFNKERVEHALNELLVRIIPDDPDEDEATANQRFEEAFNFAIDKLETAPNLSVVADINHVAGTINESSRHPKYIEGLLPTICSFTKFQWRPQEHKVPAPLFPLSVAASLGAEVADAALPPPAIRYRVCRCAPCPVRSG